MCFLVLLAFMIKHEPVILNLSEVNKMNWLEEPGGNGYAFRNY